MPSGPLANANARDCHIIITGFQAPGTTGRALVDGARHIRLWGETIRVAARIHTLGGLSAHADRAGLLAWYGHFNNRPPVFLVHGESEAMDFPAQQLHSRLGAPVTVASAGQRFDLCRL